MPAAVPRALSREHLALAGILLLAAGLIFFRLTRADVQTDAGHYALRAIGYFDFLASNRQTTPLQWFTPDPPPAWTKLSFHDHPPLVFFIEHLFFRALGVSDAVSLLPFALAGIAAVWLMFLIGRQLAGPAVGLISAGGLSIATLATWASRIGYLEGMEQAFILLAVWLFLKAYRHQRWLPLWGTALGLALLTKYSALFLVPTFLLVISWHRRDWFTDRRFWLAGSLAALVLSPVVVYNLKVWQLRGHLDVALSAVVPSAREAAAKDWPILFNGPRPLKVGVNLRDLTVSLVRAFSLPFSLLLAAGVVALLARVLRQRGQNLADLLVIAGLGSLAAFFALTAPSLRYLPIAVPWLVISAALLLHQLWGAVARRGPLGRRVVLVALVAVAAAELLFNVNTNHRFQPVGRVPWQYAGFRQESLGFQQLQRHLQDRLSDNPNFPRTRSTPKTYDEYNTIRLRRGSDIILYDSGLLWFASSWYLQRYWFYHNLLTLQDADLATLKLAEDWPTKFQRAGVRRTYYVTGLTAGVYDPWAAALGEQLSGKQVARQLQRFVDEGAPWSVTTTTDSLGRPAFKVFEIPFNP